MRVLNRVALRVALRSGVVLTPNSRWRTSSGLTVAAGVARHARLTELRHDLLHRVAQPGEFAQFQVAHAIAGLDGGLARHHVQHVAQRLFADPLGRRLGRDQARFDREQTVRRFVDRSVVLGGDAIVAERVGGPLNAMPLLSGTAASGRRARPAAP